MPGIVGIVSQQPAEQCRDLVGRMTRCLLHEEFYCFKTYCVPEMGVYGGVVVREDPFVASQVFFNERKDVALLLAGECFVDSETRAELRRKGHELEEGTGAWLLHFYEEEGDRCFEKLNGPFSGLVIDRRKNKAFLFNDRYGMERIYWHENRDGILFASEAKALLQVLPELRAFDHEGVSQFLAFGCTLEQRTLFRDVQLLPGASLWSFEDGKSHKGKYFSAANWENQPVLSVGLFECEFQATFRRILPRYFESRSKIGISLTAGLDTRMIMACLPQLEEKPVCYTFSGDRDTLDARISAGVAESCGLEHQILRLGTDFFSDFASHVDRTIYATDGYLGSLGAHEIYLNRLARALSPVRLTGVFGGEILRGVSMFKPLHLSKQLVNAGLAESVSSWTRQWSRDGVHPVTFAAFREIPARRFAMPAAGRSQVSFRTPYLDNEIVALAYRAPENLRKSTHSAWSLVRNSNAKLSKIPTDMGETGDANWLIAKSRRMAAEVARKIESHSE